MHRSIFLGINCDSDAAFMSRWGRIVIRPDPRSIIMQESIQLPHSEHKSSIIRVSSNYFFLRIPIKFNFIYYLHKYRYTQNCLKPPKSSTERFVQPSAQPFSLQTLPSSFPKSILGHISSLTFIHLPLQQLPNVKNASVEAL